MYFQGIASFIFILACILNCPSESYSQNAQLSDTLCNSVENFVAYVDATKSFNESSLRKQRYDTAKAQLTDAFKGNSNKKLLSNALEYTDLTEQVVTKDATDPKLSEALLKRSTLRESLLQSCMGEILRK